MKNEFFFNNIKIALDSEPDPAFARRARIILQGLELSGTEKILDVGCGRGFYLKTLGSWSQNLRIYGVDLNQEYLNVSKNFLEGKFISLIKADVTDLPLKDDFFDRVIASEILEHVNDDQKAIAEIYRVLKPGGWAMITVPNKKYPFFWDPLNWLLEKVFNWHVPSKIWWLAGIWADHQRLYKRQDLEKLLQKKGFIIEKFWSCTHFCFPFSHFFLYGIGKNLVERGFCSGFDRFSSKKKSSWANKFFLWPIRKIDGLNNDSQNCESSVNLIWRIRKPKG